MNWAVGLVTGKDIHMRTQVEFKSKAFPPYPGEEEQINPGVWGKRLAEFLAAQLPGQGVQVSELIAEDWGWMVPIPNEAFPMFIGCASQTDGEGEANTPTDDFMCFIDPSKPEVRRGLFKKVSTVADVKRVADALDRVLRGNPEISEIHWLDE